MREPFLNSFLSAITKKIRPGKGRILYENMSADPLFALLDGGLCGGQTRDRHTEW